MNCSQTLLLLFSFVFSTTIFGQNVTLSGKIMDAGTNEPLIGATIKINDSGTTTDFEGNYEIEIPAGQYELDASYIGYESEVRNISIQQNTTIDFQLEEEATLLQTATVTSGKFEKPLSEVTVSLEVIGAKLVESINTTSVDEVLQKVPGVQIVDGQANIRGGAGYSFGAGSRVLLLVDDIPILQADAATANWEDIPVENIDQIEVIKGAASSLYGSSAMNGIINVRTGYAKSEPETKVAAFYTTFNDPSDNNQIWYDDQPFDYGFSALHKQKFDKLDVVLGGYFLNRESFNRNTSTEYGRVNGKFRYRITDRLSAGINFNFNERTASEFFYWQGLDSLLVEAPNTISSGQRTRLNVDPYITYGDKFGNTHKLKSRYLLTDNDNNSNQSNAAQLLYNEYQFLKKWKHDFLTTAGAVLTTNSVTAELYGDTTFTSRNIAIYGQVEKKLFDRLNISAGFRFEDNLLNTPEVFCHNNIFGQEICDTITNGRISEARPVFRAGLNYQPAKATYFRASWGQGYRFPSIAEAFIVTNFGPVPVVPNPQLQSETGWSTEIGVKQGFRIGGFQGYVDVAGFWSEYQDMIEFNFINLGFQSLNVGDTRIRGLETTLAGQGKLGGITTNILAGYVYLDPRFQEFDNTGVAAGETPTEGQQNARFSSSNQNILKYRSVHSGKIDIESSYKNFSLGVAAIYNSQLEAIDIALENIVPGLTQFREDNVNGNLILSARAAYKFLGEKGKFSIIANNLTNKLYSNRPGLIEAPRSFTARIDWNF